MHIRTHPVMLSTGYTGMRRSGRKRKAGKTSTDVGFKPDRLINERSALPTDLSLSVVFEREEFMNSTSLFELMAVLCSTPLKDN
jgi:hypothetical protein